MRKKVIYESERLYARESTPSDAENAYALNLDWEVIRYTGDPPFESVEEARGFLESYDAFEKTGMGRWYVFLKETGEFIGWCGLKLHRDPEGDWVDLGYRFLKKHWNKGYATEASAACLDYGFENLEMDFVIAEADQRNTASIRVMKKLGFSFYEETQYEGIPCVKYKMTKAEWLAKD